VIYSAPILYVGNPSAKTPRANCSSKGDCDSIDLTVAQVIIDRAIILYQVFHIMNIIAERHNVIMSICITGGAFFVGGG